MSTISQVVVTVTVVGIDAKAEVYYSYTDPATGIEHVQSPHCNVEAVIPYHTIFALDYPSSRNGWRFRKNIVQFIGPDTQHWRADNRLSMITVDDDTQNHRFALAFFNWCTRAKVYDDPQEQNIRQPT